jgi:hypothetical protein
MKRIFLFLAILTVLALAVLMMVTPRDGSSEKSTAGGLLLPDIAQRVNQVDRVEIVAAGDATVATMVRTDDAWTLEQMGGYRADWPKLQALLASLAQAKVTEQKTDKAAYYDRLGVEDVSAENAGGVLIRIGIGEQVTGVLIGNKAGVRQGQYVRLQDSAASALVDREFEVPVTALDWADSSIIDINSSEVAEVEVIHRKSARVLVTKISADQTDFELANMPPDRELKSSWAVNSLGSAFSLLNMQSVRPDSGLDWTRAVKLRMLTFSGVEILADLVENGDEYLMRLHATHPAVNVVARKNTEAATGSADQAPDTQLQQAARDVEKQAADEVNRQVDEINGKVTGWAYGISQAKYQAMVKKPEDLLKPLTTS